MSNSTYVLVSNDTSMMWESMGKGITTAENRSNATTTAAFTVYTLGTFMEEEFVQDGNEFPWYAENITTRANGLIRNIYTVRYLNCYLESK